MLAAALLLGWGGCCARVQAHDLHQGQGEVQCLKDPLKLELSLSWFVEDVELALIRAGHGLMRFERRPASELDAALRAYVDSHVQWRCGAAKARLQWLGHEVDKAEVRAGAQQQVHLFFELLAPENAQGPQTLQLDALMEIFADQHHLITLRTESGRSTLRFDAKSRQRRLAVPVK